MHEEVRAMITNKIWEKVSKKSMYSYYNEIRQGCKETTYNDDVVIHEEKTSRWKIK